ncbi:hypothetical protein MUP77_06100 [Candidatus Bathyarchaeota archaeon]|nr:hypothetical protein [Candidatus Bathyarchaeota archaeon]
MENSQNPKLPKEPSQQSDSVIDMPDEWREIAFQDFFANGWKPRIKTTKGIGYITIRKGNNEKSLGPYDEDRWRLVMSMFPKRVPPPPSFPSKASLLTSSIAKPEALKSPIGVSLEVLQWFQWAQSKSKNYFGSLGDFISDVVHTYFQEQGLELIVIIPQGETQNGN